MKDLSTEIKVLTGKTKELVEKYQNLQAEYELLKQENQSLENELAEQKNQYAQLLEDNKELKISKKLLNEDSSEDTAELKKTIDAYIKEIDKCIASLND